MEGDHTLTLAVRFKKESIRYPSVRVYSRFMIYNIIRVHQQEVQEMLCVSNVLDDNNDDVLLGENTESDEVNTDSEVNNDISE